MKKILAILVFIFIALISYSNGKIKSRIDLYSRHYWRGFIMGNSPAVEPEISYFINGFTFTAWAAHTLNKSYSEIDLITSFNHNNFTFTLFDYYNPVPGEGNNYFIFSGTNNRHSLELAIDYYENEKFPLNIMVGTFFSGDKNTDTNKAFYSTYMEFAYPFLIKKTDCEIHTGFTPFKGYYAAKPAFISTGISFENKIALNEKLSLPLKIAFQMNPYTSKAFIIFGAGISKN